MGKIKNTLQYSFPFVIRRMGLACKDDLKGSPTAGKEFLEPFQIMEYQVRSLYM